MSTAVYTALRRVARERLRVLPPGQTLQATALVHEAWLRVHDQHPDLDQRQFVVFAARAIRDVLVERVRARTAEKRGGGRPALPADDALAAVEPGVGAVDLLALEQAMQELQHHQPEAAELVLLRFFAGQTLAEIAAARGVSVRTLDRQWRFARAFLGSRIGEPAGEDR